MALTDSQIIYGANISSPAQLAVVYPANQYSGFTAICGSQYPFQIYHSDGRNWVNMNTQTDGVATTTYGDSRDADLLINPYGKSLKDWLEYVCLFTKGAPIIVNDFGVSGYRTDQYLTQANISAGLYDGSQITIFNFPVVNDISQALAGYIDTYGRTITLANVVQYALGNLMDAITQHINAGKIVICVAETGSTSMTTAQVAAVHLFNQLYRNALSSLPNAPLYFNPCPVVWDAIAAGNNAIAFKANYMADGATHFGQLGARAIATAFLAQYPNIYRPVDTWVSSAADIVANGTQQIFPNPLYETLTGGTVGNATLTAGNIPGNVTLTASSAGIVSATVSSAAGVCGYDITWQLTATAPVIARIVHNPVGNAVYTLQNSFIGGIECDFTASSVANNINMWMETQINYNLSSGGVTRSAYSGWSQYTSPTNQGGFPSLVVGDTGLVYRSIKTGQDPAAISKGYVSLIHYVQFLAAGSCTVVTRRPALYAY